MICTDTDHYVNILLAIKKEKKRTWSQRCYLGNLTLRRRAMSNQS